MRTFGNARMAIAAVDAEAANMMLMAERHRLRRRMKICPRIVIRSRESDGRRDAAADNAKPCKHQQSNPTVGRGREDLGHAASMETSPQFNTARSRQFPRAWNHICLVAF